MTEPFDWGLDGKPWGEPPWVMDEISEHGIAINDANGDLVFYNDLTICPPDRVEREHANARLILEAPILWGAAKILVMIARGEVKLSDLPPGVLAHFDESVRKCEGNP